jgi:hypothetical protein
MNRTQCRMVYSYVVRTKKIVRVRVRATETSEARPVDQEARLYGPTDLWHLDGVYADYRRQHT